MPLTDFEALLAQSHAQTRANMMHETPIEPWYL